MMNTHAHTHTCMCVYMHTYAYVCSYIFAYISYTIPRTARTTEVSYMHIYIRMYIPCMHIYTRMYIHIYVCTYVCIYIRTYVCIYIHTYIHTCIYVHTHYIQYREGVDHANDRGKFLQVQALVPILVILNVQIGKKPFFFSSCFGDAACAKVYVVK